uniref:glycosyltransferase n=1 Tax=Aciditerrimonas ferrireducens TaxID=667306 RepID=UPI00366B2C98
MADGALGLVALGFVVVVVVTLTWTLTAWADPDRVRSTGDGGTGKPLIDAVGHLARQRCSVLVPARHEEPVLMATLERLVALDHPDFEVIVVVGDDDPGTTGVAREAAARWPARVRVVVDDTVPKSKPAALNRGLRAASGEIVGVFDAEDDVQADVLRHADLLLQDPSIDVVQAGTQLVTLRDRWFSTRNCLEYLFWFRSRLHAHARRGFVPLGGNTVFVRRRLLLDVGGWDVDCLAEDCELGIRLSALGARIVVAYDPASATREETPPTLRAFLRQRTRWNQGYLQVLRRGHWRRLPTRRQRALAALLLGFPLLQAASALLTPVLVVAAVLLPVPLPLTLWCFAPLLLLVLQAVVEAVAVGELARAYHLPAGWRDSWRVLWTTFPYLLLLDVAALRAIWRELRGKRGWEKTSHVGTHLRFAGPGRLGHPEEVPA